MKETVLITALLEGGAMYEGREIDGIEVTYALPATEDMDEELDFHNIIVKDPLYKGFTSYRITRIRRKVTKD
jgi:hypothetical protein